MDIRTFLRPVAEQHNLLTQHQIQRSKYGHRLSLNRMPKEPIQQKTKYFSLPVSAQSYGDTRAIEKNVENFCLSSLSLVTLGETKGNALGSFIPNQCLYVCFHGCKKLNFWQKL